MFPRFCRTRRPTGHQGRFNTHYFHATSYPTQALMLPPLPRAKDEPSKKGFKVAKILIICIHIYVNT